MSELFPAEQVSVKSPRMRWMERYAVTIIDRGSDGEDELGEFDRFSATGRSGLGMPHIVNGSTEDYAVTALAKSLGVPLWHEEGFKP